MHTVQLSGDDDDDDIEEEEKEDDDTALVRFKFFKFNCSSSCVQLPLAQY